MMVNADISDPRERAKLRRILDVLDADDSAPTTEATPALRGRRVPVRAPSEPTPEQLSTVTDLDRERAKQGLLRAGVVTR